MGFLSKLKLDLHLTMVMSIRMGRECSMNLLGRLRILLTTPLRFSLGWCWCEQDIFHYMLSFNCSSDINNRHDMTRQASIQSSNLTWEIAQYLVWVATIWIHLEVWQHLDLNVIIQIGSWVNKLLTSSSIVMFNKEYHCHQLIFVSHFSLSALQLSARTWHHMESGWLCFQSSLRL